MSENYDAQGWALASAYERIEALTSQLKDANRKLKLFENVGCQCNQHNICVLCISKMPAKEDW